MNGPMSSTMKVIQLPHGKGLELPCYETSSAAGMDLRAAIDAPVLIEPGARALIPTGLIIELPEHHEGQVRPRSGLALKHSITVLNSPGTIDADYRGEVSVVLINHGDQPFEVTRSLRIAQLVVAPVVQVKVDKVDEVSETQRGTGGYGSTGTK